MPPAHQPTAIHYRGSQAFQARAPYTLNPIQQVPPQKRVPGILPPPPEAPPISERVIETQPLIKEAEKYRRKEQALHDIFGRHPELLSKIPPTTNLYRIRRKNFYAILKVLDSKEFQDWLAASDLDSKLWKILHDYQDRAPSKLQDWLQQKGCLTLRQLTQQAKQETTPLRKRKRSEAQAVEHKPPPPTPRRQTPSPSPPVSFLDDPLYEEDYTLGLPPYPHLSNKPVSITESLQPEIIHSGPTRIASSLPERIPYTLYEDLYEDPTRLPWVRCNYYYSICHADFQANFFFTN